MKMKKKGSVMNTLNRSAMPGATAARTSPRFIPDTTPAGRDGHSGIVVNDRFIVFGGDRHRMPFNDTFIL
jgi:hypothetical protein